MAKYGSFKYGAAKYGTGSAEPGGGGGVSTPVQPRIGWILHERVGVTDYVFEINPSQAGFPGREKRMTYQPLAGGGQVVYGGTYAPETFEFSGSILTEDQYRTLQAWFKTSQQVRITDDLGRSVWVYLTAFNPSRVRGIGYPWRMDYTASAVVLDWGAT